LRYATGTRPAKARNLAIAEWPTKSSPADYALFIGTRCIGVVEAKRRNKNVSSHIDQAQRYARGFRFEGGAEPFGGPWKDNADQRFLVPFVFSSNGRPYLKQIETMSLYLANSSWQIAHSPPCSAIFRFNSFRISAGDRSSRYPLGWCGSSMR
jgi:type I site-specific restriction endonuclease